MTRTLHADPYVNVTVDEAARLVRYTRGSEPYPSVATLRASFEKIRAAFATLPNGTLALLIDVRSAPPRNDDAFETEVVQALRVLAGQFPARATLVRTAVGRLQSQRLARTRDDDSVHVFTSEAEALAYLSARQK
jgi:hypothetical protein